MAIVTYPLNNVEYTAEDAELFHVTRTSGIYARNSFQYSVSGANNIIIIGTGIGWIKNSEFAGKVIAQKESVSIDMGIADSVYPRIDAIVIQFSANSNETNIVVKKGTASTNAVAPPVVRDESVYELHLYHVLRKAGELTISPSNITDLRLDENYCGLMADSVTSVDTNAINLQISSLIENLRNEIESVEDKSAFWLKNDTIPVTNGGTGASSPEQARNNLEITAENIGALSKNGGTMSGAIAMGGNKVTGLGVPTDNADAVNKAYADQMLPKTGGTMNGEIRFQILGLDSYTSGSFIAVKNRAIITSYGSADGKAQRQLVVSSNADVPGVEGAVFLLDIVGGEIVGGYRLYGDHNLPEVKSKLGTQFTLLWQNASWNSSFEPQEITFTGKYQAYVVSFVHGQYGFEVSVLIPGASITGCQGMAYFRQGQVGGDTEHLITEEVWRYVTFSMEGGRCSFGPGYYNGSINNNWCKPVRIYGVNW